VAFVAKNNVHGLPKALPAVNGHENVLLDRKTPANQAVQEVTAHLIPLRARLDHPQDRFPPSSVIPTAI